MKNESYQHSWPPFSHFCQTFPMLTVTLSGYGMTFQRNHHHTSGIPRKETLWPCQLTLAFFGVENHARIHCFGCSFPSDGGGEPSTH
ncbi:unnamed protein product, partial [Dicrocoelium dendriticum]